MKKIFALLIFSILFFNCKFSSYKNKIKITCTNKILFSLSKDLCKNIKNVELNFLSLENIIFSTNEINTIINSDILIILNSNTEKFPEELVSYPKKILNFSEQNQNLTEENFISPKQTVNLLEILYKNIELSDKKEKETLNKNFYNLRNEFLILENDFSKSFRNFNQYFVLLDYSPFEKTFSDYGLKSKSLTNKKNSEINYLSVSKISNFINKNNIKSVFAFENTDKKILNTIKNKNPNTKILFLLPYTQKSLNEKSFLELQKENFEILNGIKKPE